MKLTKTWLDAQIEQEIERGCEPGAIRDMAALLTVRDHLYGGSMRQYGPHYNPDKVREEYHHDDGHLTPAEAEAWVRDMIGEDGKRGGRWTMQEIQQYAGNYGIMGDDVVDFFAIVNAMNADYGKVAKKYGVDKMDFWADMAKAWMHDKDAVPGKVKSYWEHIAKHD